MYHRVVFLFLLVIIRFLSAIFYESSFFY